MGAGKVPKEVRELKVRGKLSPVRGRSFILVFLPFCVSTGSKEK